MCLDVSASAASRQRKCWSKSHDLSRPAPAGRSGPREHRANGKADDCLAREAKSRKKRPLGSSAEGGSWWVRYRNRSRVLFTNIGHGYLGLVTVPSP